MFRNMVSTILWHENSEGSCLKKTVITEGLSFRIGIGYTEHGFKDECWNGWMRAKGKQIFSSM